MRRLPCVTELTPRSTKPAKQAPPTARVSSEGLALFAGRRFQRNSARLAALRENSDQRGGARGTENGYSQCGKNYLHTRMPKQQIDALISTMVQTAEGVSDLLFIVGKPPQIEIYGKLKAVDND